MSNKQRSILRVLRIMQEEGITMNELQQMSHNFESFDLLCEIDGRLKRVSFEEGKSLHPIGIFPFKDDNTYIVFDGLGHIANQNTMMDYAKKRKLSDVNIPTVSYFEAIFKIKDKLNKALKSLYKPIFKGTYLALSPDYIPEANWIVSFFDNAKNLSSDFYEAKEESRVCYIKKFKPYKVF